MLKLHMENIGIIKNADIDLPGLTVITGKNSSGKSTIGKALYSIVEGSLDLDYKYKEDRKAYVQAGLDSAMDKLSCGIYNLISANELKMWFKDPEVLEIIMSIQKGDILDKGDVIPYIKALKKKISDMDQKELATRILESQKPFRHINYLSLKEISQKKIEKGILDAREELDEMERTLLNDPGISVFSRRNIFNYLQVEYSYQIQPLRWKAKESIIRLYEDEKDDIKIVIRDNEVCPDTMINTRGTQFDGAFLVDDPTIIDELEAYKERLEWRFLADNDTFQSQRVIRHKDNLMDKLCNGVGKTLWEQTISEKKAEKIMNKLRLMLRGEFASDESGSYFVYDNGNKLKLENMATGSKTIAILEILLKNGVIRKNTLLIFDEPESHLHPEWQNELAEVIVLLVKLLGLKVVMTTHSSNFLYALDTYSLRYDLKDACAYYQVEKKDEGAICRNVNGDIELIYSDFLHYLTELKVQREKLNYCGDLKNDR